MVKPGKIKIDIDIDPLVKVMCKDTGCRHHIGGKYCCDLKHIFLSLDGKCEQRENPDRGTSGSVVEMIFDGDEI